MTEAIVIELPLRIPSSNELRGEHWSKTAKRCDLHQLVVMGHLKWRLRAVDALVWPGWVVTLTRLGPRRLDPGNFEGGFKHVQDAIAHALGVDDGSPRYTWNYRQEKTEAHGVRIRIERGP